MEIDAVLQDRPFTTSDLDVALGSHARSGVARIALRRLMCHAVPLYDEFDLGRGGPVADQAPAGDGQGAKAAGLAEEAAPADDSQASEPGAAGADRTEATDGPDPRERTTWRRFSLAGIVWVALMDRVLGTPGMTVTDLCSVVARFLMREIQHDGSLAKKHGVEVTAESRYLYPTFAEYLRRLLSGESEPYLAIVAGSAREMSVPERISLGIPGDVVISDSPAIVWGLYAQVATRFAGHLHVYPFRAAVVPVLANLRRARGIGLDAPDQVLAELRRKAEGLPELPEVPPYRPPVEPDAKLTRPEKQLLEIVRNAPELVPDVHVRVRNHEVESITYEQSYGPKGFSVDKALIDERTVQVRTIRDEGGKVRRYVVEKRLRP